jgi:predicted PurR-regulated permease PerM
MNADPRTASSADSAADDTPAMTDAQRWLIALSIAGLGWLVFLLSPILMPFVAGATLAYLSDPMADQLEKLGLRRTAAVVLVFLALFVVLELALLLLLPALESQIDRLVQNLPALLRWMKSTVLPWISDHFGVSLRLRSLDDISNLITQHWAGAGGAASYVLSYLSRSGVALLAWLANLFLIPVVTFYLLRDWDRLVAHVLDLLPRRYVPTVTKLVGEADTVLSSFMRGQLTVMLALTAIYCTGLWLVGLDLAFLVGCLAGMVSFIPYAGSLVGIASASIAAIVQFGDLWSLVPVLMVFGVGQAIEGIFLTPWLVGDRIGLHPVAVIFSVLAGGQLFGFLGVLLALPVASVVMVLIRHVHDVYKDSSFYVRSKHDDAHPGAQQQARPAASGVLGDGALPPNGDAP